MAALAVIVHPPAFAIGAFVAGLVPALRRDGLRLSGLVQHGGGSGGVRGPMALEDLATGEIHGISADRGAGARGCRLDASGLAAAGRALARAEGDLVIVNKFGKQEALGRGLRDEIAALVVAGRPVLTAVHEELLPAWTAFAGEGWTRLPPDAEAVRAWAARVPAAAI